MLARLLTAILACVEIVLLEHTSVQMHWQSVQLNGDYLGNPVWTLKELQCIQCPYGKFTSVSGKLACDSCESFNYVLEEIVTCLQMRTTTYTISVPFLKSCEVCPAGTEYQADATAVKKEQRCSSSKIDMMLLTILV
jgi:hypothetical protein